MEDPIPAPYASYTIAGHKFITAVYDFDKKNPDFELKEYFRLLDERNINTIEDANIDELDAQGTMACLMRFVRSERFGEGRILSALEEGYIQKLLKHLKEL